MSLIVARQINNEIFIIADTKFTDENKTQAKQYIGGLKIILLAPGVFIAFAGVVHYAQKAIKKIYDKKINLFDKNQIINYFLDQHNESLHQTDFIVGVIVEKNEDPNCYEKEIFKISNGLVEWQNQVTHIGEDDAFSKFQSYFHSDDNKRPVPIFEICRLGNKENPVFHNSLSKAMKAMRQVIEDLETPTVDGIRTIVISEKDQFRYIQYMQINGNPIPVRQEPNSPVSFGGAAEGSDIKHVGLCSGVGLGIFPVYSETGKFGIIYHPEDSFEPKIVNCNSKEEFIEHVNKRIIDAHKRILIYQESADNYISTN